MDNRRQYPRVPTDITIALKTRDGRQFEALAVDNISLGGIFIHMDPPLGFGTEVAIEFGLKDPKKLIRSNGFIVWSRREANEEGPVGIGIRLTDISISDMRALEQYIDDILRAK